MKWPAFYHFMLGHWGHSSAKKWPRSSSFIVMALKGIRFQKFPEWFFDLLSLEHFLRFEEILDIFQNGRCNVLTIFAYMQMFMKFKQIPAMDNSGDPMRQGLATQISQNGSSNLHRTTNDAGLSESPPQAAWGFRLKHKPRFICFHRRSGFT